MVCYSLFTAVQILSIGIFGKPVDLTAGER